VQQVIQNTPIPSVGFGTWQITGQDCVSGVRDALHLGYRHIDTAQIYDNEAEVGQGIADSGVDRDQIWLTTKVWRSALSPKAIVTSTEESLRKLSVDHVDLLLVHWPIFKQATLAQILEAFVGLQERELTRHIGVSNFPSKLLDQAAQLAPLFTNQVEYHPYLDQSPVLKVCRKHGLLLTAYSPLARGKVLNDPVLTEIGAKTGHSAAQVALRWLVQQPGVSAIPKASSEKNRKANLAVSEFEISASDMARIHALAKPDGRVIDPPFAPNWD
jgi:2,5-diketo-D-gluconate reductase B